MVGTKTRISRASTKNESLRTTVPSSIIKQFNLTVGDTLVWILEVDGSEIGIKVMPESNTRSYVKAEKVG